MIYNIVVPTTVTLLSYVVFYVARSLYRTWTSPLKFVDGPSSFNFLTGHSIVDVPEIGDKWREQYGSMFMTKGMFGANDLHIKDVKAVAHILGNNLLYPKPFDLMASLSRILGKGILSVEADPHKRQRKILLPAFNIQQIRMMNEVFVEKAVLLRDLLAADVDKAGGTATVDLAEMFRRVTLDIIGATGFGYNFQSLESNGKNEGDLSKAFSGLISVPNANFYRAVQLAQATIPALKLLKSQAEARAMGEKELGSGRDLLSILVKANMSADIPDSQKLTDAEVISQIPTFLLAGHETSSAALGWAAHALSKHPSVQERLRQELLTVQTDTPTMDELNALPYFETVLREILRLYTPAVFSQREALNDDVLPLKKPFVDRWGVSHESVPVPQGQLFTIPLLAMNTDKEIWGEDALEFKPERWNDLPDAVDSMPGIWGHQMTFLGGAHSCMGFRFSMAEQKAVLFSLLRAFELMPGPEPVGPEISQLFQRPVSFASDGKGGRVSTGGLPIVLKALKGII
ncbi:unnamed protein product [Mycena citricolor]|uniref:Cytochrome P450 n=1 Tax=Mycena citricolor TaxID=2018698 RepID=A0AAD2H807_9AGAR|nr:unnamed protein product [Mycena citricolor]CAK5284804.1 unnamed protein product [Mycena citricolor]